MNELFKTNPNLKEAFVTADGTAFYNNNDAKNHAKTLKDKTVETVYNPKELEVVDAYELTEDEKELEDFESAEKEKEAKEAVAKALTDFDLETTKYPEALKLFKALELTAENEKKETIYPLLLDAKTKQETNTQA